MIRMIKKISVAAVIFLCLIFGLQSISSATAASERRRMKMQQHINEAKIKKPKEYQEMVNKVGTIVNCMSCHVDTYKKQKDTK